MAISVKVVPDFSAFRTPTVEDIVAEIGCDEVLAEAFLEHFTVLPK